MPNQIYLFHITGIMSYSIISYTDLKSYGYCILDYIMNLVSLKRKYNHWNVWHIGNDLFPLVRTLFKSIDGSSGRLHPLAVHLSIPISGLCNPRFPFLYDYSYYPLFLLLQLIMVMGERSSEGSLWKLDVWLCSTIEQLPS